MVGQEGKGKTSSHTYTKQATTAITADPENDLQTADHLHLGEKRGPPREG